MTQTLASTRVQLIAPLTGILVPIEMVPDPVFAKKMVGDGISIDPLSGVLLAPIDGEVVNVQPAKHAVTIRSADGLEVLLHIGLDTVRMGGKGFQAKVKAGQQVSVGDELIAFDLDTVAFVRRMHELGLYASISLGIKEQDRATVDALAAQGLVPDYITIDIAHGHADSVKHMIWHIKDKLPQSFVIAGNVGTPEAVIDVENWGADATKVGIGPGKVCITKLKTGFGTGGWQLSAVKWCARVATKPLIADGGIRSHGDIAKSIRFGATMVMVGALFAGHEESPGRTVEVDGELFKEYYGSASDFNKGEYRHVEGKRILEPIKGKLADTLLEMQQDLQSSISYSGGRALMDIRKVNYVILGGDNNAEHLLM